jgi:hypothetical protein
MRSRSRWLEGTIQAQGHGVTNVIPPSLLMTRGGAKICRVARESGVLFGIGGTWWKEFDAVVVPRSVGRGTCLVEVT